MTQLLATVLALLASLAIGLGKEHESYDRFPIVVEDKYGYIDGMGNVAIEPQFDSAASFSDGLALVKVAGKWGYINVSGRQVIAVKFESARSFSEGLGTVFLRDSAGTGWRIIDQTGRVVIRSRFDQPVIFSDGRAWFATRGYWRGCIDRFGDTVIEPTFPYEDRSFSEGLAYALFRGRHGYIDKNGKVAVEANFDWGGDFHEGLAYFMNEGTPPDRWGYIDKAGRVVIKPQYGRAGDFSEGLAPVSIDGKWGYIARTGKVVIAARFAEARGFSEGLAAVKLAAVGNARYKVLRLESGRDARGGHAESDSSGYGYIDKSGKMAIKPQFDCAGDFSDGLAEAWVVDRTDPRYGIASELPPPRQRYGYIDKRGNYVWETIEPARRGRR
jgi:hypothetical protein